LADATTTIVATTMLTMVMAEAEVLVVVSAEAPEEVAVPAEAGVSGDVHQTTTTTNKL
jgi:hypothetical protein